MSTSFLKRSKCEFVKPEIRFLGHTSTEEGISTDPEKIASTAEFLTPKNMEDIHAFLGLTGFYHRFPQQCSETITSLLEPSPKGHKWKREQTLHQ